MRQPLCEKGQIRAEAQVKGFDFILKTTGSH